MTIRTRRYRIFCFFLLFLLGAVQASQAENIIHARLIRVVDGDTFFADIIYPGGMAQIDIGIRIAGIDTPELRDKRAHIRKLAQKAKQYAQSHLTRAEHITLHSVKRGKYYRLIAVVEVDGQDLGQLLMQQGLAKPYQGGKRPEWQ